MMPGGSALVIRHYKGHFWMLETRLLVLHSLLCLSSSVVSIMQWILVAENPYKQPMRNYELGHLGNEGSNFRFHIATYLAACTCRKQHGLCRSKECPSKEKQNG